MKDEEIKVKLFNSIKQIGKKAVYYPFLDKRGLHVHKSGKRVFIESKAGIGGGRAVVFVSDIGNVCLDNIDIVQNFFKERPHESFYDQKFDHKW